MAKNLGCNSSLNTGEIGCWIKMLDQPTFNSFPNGALLSPGLQIDFFQQLKTGNYHFNGIRTSPGSSLFIYKMSKVISNRNSLYSSHSDKKV